MTGNLVPPQCPGSISERAPMWNQPTSTARVPPVNGGRSWQLIIKHDLTHWPMDEHLVSAQVSGFHIGEGTDVEPAHFLSQGPPVNGGRSWQLIVKHYLTHWLYDRTFVAHPSVRFHIGEGNNVETSYFWSQGQLVIGSRSWQLIIKHDLTHCLHGRTLGVSPVSGFHIGEGTEVEPAHFWSQGPPVNGGRSWQLIVKHDLTHWPHGRTLGVGPSVRVPHL